MGIHDQKVNFAQRINSRQKSSLEELSFKKQYILGKKLGDGACGSVYECKRLLDNKDFAVKISKTRNDDHEHDINEKSILKHLNKNKHVTQLIDSFEDIKQSYIVMELCKRGDLFDYIVKGIFKDEKRCKEIFRKIVEAVHELHESNIVHRDLKPENILLTKNGIKICDFGIAFKKDTKTNKNLGTPVFKAPEMLKGEYYDHKIDWWACGVILYTMILVRFPFETPDNCNNATEINKKKLLQKIQIKKGLFYKIDGYKNLPNDVKDLISTLLKVDPNKRYGYKDIMKHPWMKSN